MTIYIDEQYKCHTEPGEGYRAAETDYFDSKCAEYIEGYRFVPKGETWVREDGAAFAGEMIAAWKPWGELDAAQRDYERERAAALEAALTGIEEALGI